MLSENNCIGYPYCDEKVDNQNIACRTCWFKFPSRLRNLLKALIYKGAKEETRKRIMNDALNFLHPKLKFSLEAKAARAQYTVVPYTGRRVRKKRKMMREDKLKQLYYGGPWDYQK